LACIRVNSRLILFFPLILTLCHLIQLAEKQLRYFARLHTLTRIQEEPNLVHPIVEKGPSCRRRDRRAPFGPAHFQEAQAVTAGEPAAWTVYMLRCGDGSLYTGITNDLASRMREHLEGKGSRYVRSRLPFELAYEEPARDRSAALRREAAIKKMDRAGKMGLISGWPRAIREP
jgi:putative endonuclease